MRNTVDTPDAMYRQLKTRAATEGRSVKDLILRGVETELRRDERRVPRRIKLPIVRSKKPGSVRLDNDQTLINDALRQDIARVGEPLEETLRRVIREEIRHAS